MIPAISEQFSENFTFEESPSKDYALDINNSIVNGTIENIDAIKQAIYFILNTERYDYIIYSWNYGVEFSDLIGMPSGYVIPEVERRIQEALMQDERIESVTDFEFEQTRNILHVTFHVATIYGTIESEVDVNV